MKKEFVIFNLSTKSFQRLSKEQEDEAVQELIEILEAGFTFQSAYIASKSDGKIDWQDSFNFIGFLQKLPVAISGSEKVLQLFRKFSANGKKLIMDYVGEKFDLSDDAKEALIERTLAWLLDGVLLFTDWQDNRRIAA